MTLIILLQILIPVSIIFIACPEFRDGLRTLIPSYPAALKYIFIGMGLSLAGYFFYLFFNDFYIHRLTLTETKTNWGELGTMAAGCFTGMAGFFTLATLITMREQNATQQKQLAYTMDLEHHREFSSFLKEIEHNIDHRYTFTSPLKMYNLLFPEATATDQKQQTYCNKLLSEYHSLSHLHKPKDIFSYLITIQHAIYIRPIQTSKMLGDVYIDGVFSGINILCLEQSFKDLFLIMESLCLFSKKGIAPEHYIPNEDLILSLQVYLIFNPGLFFVTGHNKLHALAILSGYIKPIEDGKIIKSTFLTDNIKKKRLNIASHMAISEKKDWNDFLDSLEHTLTTYSKSSSATPHLIHKIGTAITHIQNMHE